MSAKTIQREKKSFTVPHVLVLIVGLIVICCALTYVLPAGVYDKDEAGYVIADSFHYVDRSPVSLWDALMDVANGISSQGSIIALLLIMGGTISVIIESGAVSSVINFAVYRLQDKSIKVLVPSIVVLMSVIGALAGQDSLVAFVAVGLILVKRLRLDRIAAMSIFYLSYLTGQAAGPTVAIILMAQETAGLQPVSGLGCRLVVWAVLTLTCALYTTRYCLRISRDPGKSILGQLEVPDDGDTFGQEVPKLSWQAIVSICCMFVPFAVYAYGAAALGWGFNQLMGFAILAVMVVGVVNRIGPSELSNMFVTGAAPMGGVCVMIGFAKVIGNVLQNGLIMDTIAHAAAEVIGSFGSAAAASGIFLFTTLFNLLVPSGPAKVSMMVPLFVPVADVLGITRQVMCLGFQLGDGLTNYITPVSSVLAAALGMTGVNYGKWLKYVLPYVLITFVISIVALSIRQTIGWS